MIFLIDFSGVQKRRKYCHLRMFERFSRRGKADNLMVSPLFQRPVEFFARKVKKVFNAFDSWPVASVSFEHEKHCFDSWESSNNRKYYFTSIKNRERENYFSFSLFPTWRLHWNLVKNNFVLSSFKYILPWTAEISQHFPLIYVERTFFTVASTI